MKLSFFSKIAPLIIPETFSPQWVPGLTPEGRGPWCGWGFRWGDVCTVWWGGKAHHASSSSELLNGILCGWCRGKGLSRTLRHYMLHVIYTWCSKLMWRSWPIPLFHMEVAGRGRCPSLPWSAGLPWWPPPPPPPPIPPPPLTAMELKSNLDAMCPNMSPRVDGIPVEFYLAFWPLVADFTALAAKLLEGRAPLPYQHCLRFLTLTHKRGHTLVCGL